MSRGSAGFEQSGGQCLRTIRAVKWGDWRAEAGREAVSVRLSEWERGGQRFKRRVWLDQQDLGTDSTWEPRTQSEAEVLQCGPRDGAWDEGPSSRVFILKCSSGWCHRLDLPSLRKQLKPGQKT